MPQPQVKQFPGYGIVYPDGVSGIKVVGTFTQGPSKSVNPDGSVVYSTPVPTIHELFGGGFTYASGERVTKREHLEVLPGKMRDRALKWFDDSGEISKKAQEGIPALNLDEKQRPEPVYVLSSDLPKDKDEVTEELNRRMKETKEVDAFAQILDAVKSLSQTVKEQGQQIADLKTRQKDAKQDKRRKGNISEEEVAKRSARMKAMWDRRKGIKSGNDTTETSKNV